MLNHIEKSNNFDEEVIISDKLIFQIQGASLIDPLCFYEVETIWSQKL